MSLTHPLPQIPRSGNLRVSLSTHERIEGEKCKLHYFGAAFCFAPSIRLAERGGSSIFPDGEIGGGGELLDERQVYGEY